jgi:hypothetical protein
MIVPGKEIKTNKKISNYYTDAFSIYEYISIVHLRMNVFNHIISLYCDPITDLIPSEYYPTTISKLKFNKN